MGEHAVLPGPAEGGQGARVGQGRGERRPPGGDVDRVDEQPGGAAVEHVGHGADRRRDHRDRARHRLEHHERERLGGAGHAEQVAVAQRVVGPG